MPAQLSRRFRFVLVGPKSPGNVGAAARALKNMGFSQLAVAEPVVFRDAGYLVSEARRMAVGAGEILDRLVVADSLDELLPPHAHVVATSARGRTGLSIESPREAAPRLVGLAERAPVVVLFGPEDTGLNKRHLARSAEALKIPTSRAHTTLNVSQALLLVCYELRQALAGWQREPPEPASRPTQQALRGFNEDLEETLTFIDFLKPHNGERVLSDLRALIVRAGPDVRELSMLRGVLRQMRWLRKRVPSR